MSSFSIQDEQYMRMAIKEARTALKNGNYPVGAVLVIDGEVVGKISNSNQSGNSWMNHAEFQSILTNAEKIKIAKTQNHS